MNRDKKAKTEPVRKPYLTGSVTDGNTLREVLMFLATLLVCGFAYLLVGGMASGTISVVSAILNVLLILVSLTIYYYFGMSNGTSAVSHGEVMQRRLDTGREVTPAERARGFHPLKGYATGLLGTAPLFLAALALALITKRQMMSPGYLPSWVSAPSGRPDVLQPLTVYTVREPLTAESLLRMVIRIAVMPWVSLTGSQNTNGLLLLERLTPLIVLLPALAYGTGYLGGVRVRTRVHTDIAANARKRARKEKRRIRQKNAARKPEQLN